MARKVQHISAGSETEDRFNLLMTRVNIRSEDILGGLYDHLVEGNCISVACSLNQIKSEGNLERAVEKVNEVAAFVVAIEEYDWQRFRQTGKIKGKG